MNQVFSTYFIALCLIFQITCPSKLYSNNTDQKPRDVTLQLKWKHQFQFAGYYAAIEKGYFSDAGINVKLIEAGDNQDTNDAVFNGSAEFGISTSEVLLLRSKGKNPVVLASVFQHSPIILLSLEKSGIRHAQDLAGKKIAFENNSHEITAYLNSEGVPLDKCIIIPPTFDINQLINNEADVIVAYSTDLPFQLEELNINYSVISPLMGGIDFYGDVLFTTASLIKTDPVLVANFRQAALKGWKYALEHQDETVDLIFNKYSQRHSKEYLMHEADHMKSLIMKDVVEIGYSNPDRWHHILEIYKNLNLIDKSQTINGLLYADYLENGYSIPWKLILLFSLIIVIVSSVTWFFYSTSLKLKIEIKNRTHVQKELASSEETYRNLVESINELIYEVSAEGTIKYASPAVKRILGYQPEEITGKNIFGFIHPDDRQDIINKLSGLMDKNYSFHEYRLIDKDNIVHWVRSSTSAIISNGVMIGGTGSMTDITERKLDEERIVKANRFYLFISKVNEAIILLKDKQKLFGEICKIAIDYGKFRMAWVGLIDDQTKTLVPVSMGGFENGYLSEIKSIRLSEDPEGRGPGGAAAKEGKIFICNDIEHDTRMVVWKDAAMKRGYSSSIGLPIKRNSKTIGVVSLYSSAPNFFDLEEIGLLDKVANNISFAITAIEIEKEKNDLYNHLEIKVKERTSELAATNENLSIEIEERKKAEIESTKAQLEAEKATMAKSEFLSRMSHELRTPMNSILGFAQLLEMGLLNPTQKKGVGHILRSGKHLLNLINEVLDITRIESGSLSLSIEPVKVNDVIQEMMDTMRPNALEYQVVLSFSGSATEQVFVKADHQRFKQVLLNLISNAIKYNRKGGNVLINVDIVQSENGRKQIARISVTDNGPGISHENINKLFSPFERIGAESTETEGSGLGLVVVKKLMEAMGGTIGLNSVLGEGSTFWFELPVCSGQTDENMGLLPSENPGSKSGLASGMVLYIEDNASNIELVGQIFSSHLPNLQFISNTYGRQAVNLAKEHKPFLILLDLNLPDIHGSEVLKLLQNEDKTKSIPVVVISADAMPKQMEKLMNGGAKYYLTKPLDVPVLIKIIDEFIPV